MSWSMRKELIKAWLLRKLLRDLIERRYMPYLFEQVAVVTGEVYPEDNHAMVSSWLFHNLELGLQRKADQESESYD